MHDFTTLTSFGNIVAEKLGRRVRRRICHEVPEPEGRCRGRWRREDKDGQPRKKEKKKIKPKPYRVESNRVGMEKATRAGEGGGDNWRGEVRREKGRRETGWAKGGEFWSSDLWPDRAFPWGNQPCVRWGRRAKSGEDPGAGLHEWPKNAPGLGPRTHPPGT